MAEVHIGLDGIYKATCNGILGPLVMPVKGREGILFTWFQVKLGWSQNSFNMPLGFTLTPDKIHGTRGAFTVKLTSEILKRGQFSLITEDSILTGLMGAGPKMLSMSSKTFKLRVFKLRVSKSE